MMDRFDDQASKILSAEDMNPEDHPHLCKAIASALHAAVLDAVMNGSLNSYQLISQAVHARGVLDCTDFEKGPVVRRVLGKLCLTADGAIITPTGFIWMRRPTFGDVIGFTSIVMYSSGPNHREFDPKYSDCYSTREAAEAARGKVG